MQICVGPGPFPAFFGLSALYGVQRIAFPRKRVCHIAAAYPRNRVGYAPTRRSLFLEQSDQKSAAELLRSKPLNHSVRHGGCRLSALRSMG